MLKPLNSLTQMPILLHGAALAASFAGFGFAKARLDASYAASNHPVDFATGQLAFDADLIEGYYAVMERTGTLGVYWRTQFIDFGFIASVVILAALVGSFVARLNRDGSWGRRLGIAAAMSGMAGGAFDALENLISFVMLQSPGAIAQPVAMAYSSAAAVKFGLLTLAMGLAVLAVLWAVATILFGAARNALRAGATG